MKSVEVNIVEAATACFLEAGAKRTNMTVVARAAGVSRQTVYSYFPCKDKLLAAVTEGLMTTMLSTISKRWRACDGLSDKLDVFFETAILEPFDILARHPELKDLLLGAGAPAAQVAMKADAEKARLLSEQLAPHSEALGAQGTTPDALAAYIAHVSKELKYTCHTRAELEQKLHLLKASALLLSLGSTRDRRTPSLGAK